MAARDYSHGQVDENVPYEEDTQLVDSQNEERPTRWRNLLRSFASTMRFIFRVFVAFDCFNPQDYVEWSSSESTTTASVPSNRSSLADDDNLIPKILLPTWDMQPPARCSQSSSEEVWAHLQDEASDMRYIPLDYSEFPECRQRKNPRN